jgi:hypothetical protein
MVVRVANRVVRWGGLKVARRLSKAVPLLGGVIAVATIGATMRRKGIVRGGLDAGLNATPFIGAAKLAFESVWGRDMIPDRARPSSPASDATRPARA